MGKRRSVQNNNLPRLNGLGTTASGYDVSSPTGWFSAIKTQNPSQDEDDQFSSPMSFKSDKSSPQLEIKLPKLSNDDLLKTTKDNNDVEHFNEISPAFGLKTSNFYGGNTPSFQFGIKKTPNKQQKPEEIKKKNGQVKKNSKRKRVASGKNTKSRSTKKTKQDDTSFNGAVNGGTHNDVAEKKENGVMGHVSNTSTILDIITPESSPSDCEDKPQITTNGFYTKNIEKVIDQGTNVKHNIQSNDYLDGNDMAEIASSTSQCTKIITSRTSVSNILENGLKTKSKVIEEYSESGSQYSEDSLISGFGSVNGSTLIKGENGEYYFSNSNESSPDLTRNGPSKCFQTPTSSQSSQNSLASKDRTVFLFGKDPEGSSYSPTSSSSNNVSPEHQTSITSFFKISTKQTGVGSGKVKTLERSKASNKDKKKMEQMYLDLGQRNFGHVTCTTCGMVYTHAQPDDEVEHIRYHKKFVNGLRFNGWKDEHVVKEYSDGRIIMIKPDDHPSHQKKAEEIRKVVDSELGFAVDLPYRKNESKTFLFIAKKRVVGCCVATQIDKGYPVLPSTPNKDSTPDRQIAAWCCSTVPVPAQCGISKIWVWNQYRRKKVATRLIECVRTHFIYGCVISKDVLAFSDPTPDGKRLATSYIGTPEFLVFH